MKKTTILILLLVTALLVFGCSPKTQTPTGYATSGQQQQQPYYGGGCGVSPDDNAVEVIESVAETSSSSL